MSLDKFQRLILFQALLDREIKKISDSYIRMRPLDRVVLPWAIGWLIFTVYLIFNAKGYL
jgi:hypothetical protein